MEIGLQVDGCEEMAANLRGLAVDVRDKFVLRALKAGGKIVRDNSQALAPVRTGALATSITVGTKDKTVLVGPNRETHDTKDKRKMRNDNIAVFIEGGTVNHFVWTGQRITAAEARRKKKNVIAFQKTEQRTPPRPFLKTALESSAQEAFQAEADTLRGLIEERVSKGAKP